MDADEEHSPHFPPPSREIVQAARELRHWETHAEAVLWTHLRGRRLLGRKFRRQHPVGGYVLDFFCDDARLVVELDGAIHFDPGQRERDGYREEALKAMGLIVLRFRNEEIFHNLDDVLRRIEAHVKGHSYEVAGASSPVPPSGSR